MSEAFGGETSAAAEPMRRRFEDGPEDMILRVRSVSNDGANNGNREEGRAHETDSDPMEDPSLGNLSLLVECVGGQSRERAHADEPTAEAVFRGILLSPFQSLLLRELLLLLPLLYGEFLPQAV